MDSEFRGTYSASLCIAWRAGTTKRVSIPGRYKLHRLAESVLGIDSWAP